jgi:uncharacterized protein YjbJ (UPF0337 family)
MGLTDKAKNATQDAAGRLRETTGKAADDKNLKSKGKADQSKSSLKKAGENIKHAFKR